MAAPSRQEMCMFDQAGERVAISTIDSALQQELIRYVSDDHSPLILDTALHQAQHAALVAAGCESQIRQYQRN